MTRKRILIALGILILYAFLFVIGLSKRGAVDLYQLRLERDRLCTENLALQKENDTLRLLIQRLKNDVGFLENIARTDLGMIRKDEVVILRKKNR